MVVYSEQLSTPPFTFRQLFFPEPRKNNGMDQVKWYIYK